MELISAEGSTASQWESTHSYDLHHLLRIDRSVAVDVVHLEGPLELLLRSSGGSDVDGEQELFEVDPTAVVGVERAEDVLAELVGVARWKEAGVDFEKLVARQLTARTVSLSKRPLLKEFI